MSDWTPAVVNPPPGLQAVTDEDEKKAREEFEADMRKEGLDHEKWHRRHRIVELAQEIFARHAPHFDHEPEWYYTQARNFVDAEEAFFTAEQETNTEDTDHD